MFQRKENTKERQESEQLKKELLEAKRKADENLAGWKRTLADFANFKKDQEKIQEEFVKFSQASLILEILPVLDNFETAWKTLPKDIENNAWVKGIGHVKSQLENLLKSKGVEEIGKVGEEFNPEVHEAVEKELKAQSSKLKAMPTESSIHDKIRTAQNATPRIVEIMQKGYKLHGKVIRPAKVRVN
jgi:molecular chaperone GrpE